jgi:Serine carboxypeptidase
MVLRGLQGGLLGTRMRAFFICLSVLMVSHLQVAAIVLTERLRETDLTHLGKENTLDSALAGPERVSGYFKLNRTHDAHMFYFYFEARENARDAPVVLWMTGLLFLAISLSVMHSKVISEHCVPSRAIGVAGGPGCSSELAVFQGKDHREPVSCNCSYCICTGDLVQVCYQVASFVRRVRAYLHACRERSMGDQ